MDQDVADNLEDDNVYSDGCSYKTICSKNARRRLGVQVAPCKEILKESLRQS